MHAAQLLQKNSPSFQIDIGASGAVIVARSLRQEPGASDKRSLLRRRYTGMKYNRTQACERAH
jgi:hypothetical protein